MENSLRESPEAKSSENVPLTVGSSWIFTTCRQAGGGVGWGLHMQMALTVPQFPHVLSALVIFSNI